MDHILVVGLRDNAGKTSIACATISLLREKGFKACGFKPRAGNSVWYDYDIVSKALNQGRLYGKDASLLKTYSKTVLPEEVINPVHRLWAEAPAFIEYSKLPTFIVDRITLPDKKLVVINDALPFSYSVEELVRKLRNSNPVVHVSDMKEYNMVIRENYDPATRFAYEEVMKHCDIIVHESYSDVALPWKGIKRLNSVLVVEPGFVYVYDGEKYLSAVKLTKGREAKTRRALDLLKPVKKIEIPPLDGDIIEKIKNISSLWKVCLEPFIT